MSIPITIEKLLNDNIVESARIEFKEGWNPDTTLKTISAFANDIDNRGGGYIIIGIKENNGKISYPIEGLKLEEIDKIQKEILRYCNFLKPKYIPETEIVKYQEKYLILIWCPGGYERPYLCPKKPSLEHSEKIYYIRKLSSTIEATPSDIKELIALTNNIPFDDRINLKASISDLRLPLIKNFLEEVESSLLTDFETKKLEDIAKNLRIADGPKEFFKPINVGLLFFNDSPDKFFPYCQIDLVNIPDPTGQGMEERVFKGPIDQQLKDALRYIKNNVIAEKIFKIQNQAEAKRIKNYKLGNNILVWIVGLVVFFFMIFLFEMDEKQQSNYQNLRNAYTKLDEHNFAEASKGFTEYLSAHNSSIYWWLVERINDESYSREAVFQALQKCNNEIEEGK